MKFNKFNLNFNNYVIFVQFICTVSLLENESQDTSSGKRNPGEVDYDFGCKEAGSYKQLQIQAYISKLICKLKSIGQMKSRHESLTQYT